MQLRGWLYNCPSHFCSSSSSSALPSLQASSSRALPSSSPVRHAESTITATSATLSPKVSSPVTNKNNRRSNRVTSSEVSSPAKVRWCGIAEFPYRPCNIRLSFKIIYVPLCHAICQFQNLQVTFLLSRMVLCYVVSNQTIASLYAWRTCCLLVISFHLSSQENYPRLFSIDFAFSVIFGAIAFYSLF